MQYNRYELPVVSFGSDLVRAAFKLERLRGGFGQGSTPAVYLRELHSLFQLLMSVISARIEGNRTTVYDALKEQPEPDDSSKEIANLIRAMEHLDRIDPAEPITHSLIRQLHHMTVTGLVREGDPTPGAYRKRDVEITRPSHVPPSHVYVHAEMSDFLEFANQDVGTSEQMIHVAIAHHRFLWVHPFTNGNGRVSRLLSYAMLRRHGFVSSTGLRTVNPTAVFGNDRDGYYEALSAADDLSNEGTVTWCTFFVTGILADMERLTRLQDFQFTLGELFLPTTRRMYEAGVITEPERQALDIVFEKVVVKAGDLEPAFPGTPQKRSAAINQLLEKGLLVQDTRGPRFYRVDLGNRRLGPYLIRQLDAIGFLPQILRDDRF